MPSADLRYRVGFYQRGSSGGGGGSPPPPDYGSGPGYPSVATFITYANILEKMGGEQILAARLSGKHFVNITVRQSPDTNAVDTDWMAKNEDTGEAYNIRSVIDPHSSDQAHHMWWEMLAEKGVAV
jgi:hypothetical protein